MMISQRQLIMRKLKSMVGVGIGGAVAFAGIGVWTGNDSFFEQYMVPLLSKLDPEQSHRLAVFATKYHLIRAFKSPDPTNLGTKIAGLSLNNAVGVAAGFDKNGECISGLFRHGFGFVEIGSVTPLPQEGNEKPRVFRLYNSKAVINRYGFNNVGHEAVLKNVESFKKSHPNQVLGVNLGANKNSENRVNDYCEGIRRFSSVADYFVINVSSPNTPQLRNLLFKDNLRELMKDVKATRDKQDKKVPLFLKVSPDISDQEIKSICETLCRKECRVDGIIVCNTTICRENVAAADRTMASEAGGLSGQPLCQISTNLIRKFYLALPNSVPIIGCGGISSGADAYEKICAGASAIQIYTVMTYKGLGCVTRIKNDLSTLLAKNNFDSIESARGSYFNAISATDGSAASANANLKTKVSSMNS